MPLLQERFRERSAEDWLTDLEAAGVPAGKVRSIPDALEAAAAAGRPATVTVEHPTAGPLDLVASPIWGATRTEATPPPLLGEHTARGAGGARPKPRGDRGAGSAGRDRRARRKRRALVRLARARCRRAGLLGQ